MRLFTAIDLSDEVRANIESLQKKLKPAAKIQWSRASNLHITTKFIGEWPASRLEELKSALGAVARTGALEISIGRTGWFPNPHSPRVFWVGVQAPPQWQALAKATDAATTALGVTAESKPYTPHLTLARIRTPEHLGALHDAIAKLPSQEFGGFSASEYHLYLSEPSRDGSIYIKLADFTLIQ